jgi:hypothetical protein
LQKHVDGGVHRGTLPPFGPLQYQTFHAETMTMLLITPQTDSDADTLVLDPEEEQRGFLGTQPVMAGYDDEDEEENTDFYDDDEEYDEDYEEDFDDEPSANEDIDDEEEEDDL